MRVNSGTDYQSRVMNGGTLVGAIGTSTGTAAGTMTDTGATWGTTAFVGGWVQCANRYAMIISHTGTVLTIDRWYDPTNPGAVAAASTPAATSAYIILPGSTPAAFMALTANTTAVAATDTVLTGEITTVGGGLIRKMCTLAHTAGVASYTLTAVFTANGTDALPVTIGKMGIFNSMQASVGTMLFATLVSPTATLSASGDQLTVTDTVSM